VRGRISCRRGPVASFLLRPERGQVGKAKRLEIVGTDGTRAIRLIWLRIGRDGGIYGSFFHPSMTLHRSYHRDGIVHWRYDRRLGNAGAADEFFKESGYSRDVDSGPPLGSFTGHFLFLQGGFRLDPDCFEDRKPYRFKAVDHLLIVDSRVIQGDQRHMNFYIDLVEANSFQRLGERMAEFQRIFTSAARICEHHCYLELEPWVLVSLAYSSR